MAAKPWLGVPEHMLTSGTAVLVVAGGGGAPRHRPALICYATVDGPADTPGVWWLKVHYGGPTAPLPQMFRTEEIVGVPALDLAPATQLETHGTKVPDNIDDLVAEWHRLPEPRTQPLHEYLGWTWDEYQAWSAAA